MPLETLYREVAQQLPTMQRVSAETERCAADLILRMMAIPGLPPIAVHVICDCVRLVCEDKDVEFFFEVRNDGTVVWNVCIETGGEVAPGERTDQRVYIDRVMDIVEKLAETIHRGDSHERQS